MIRGAALLACFVAQACAAEPCGGNLAGARTIESSRYVVSYVTAPRDIVPGEHFVVDFAVCPRDGATASVLLKHADEATFRARAHGAGHAFFDPRLDP